MQANLDILSKRNFNKVKAGIVKYDVCDGWGFQSTLSRNIEDCDSFEELQAKHGICAREAIYEYCDRLNKRFPEAEPYLMQSAEWAYLYADYIIGARWPEAEPFIMQSPEYAYEYALNVIMGRWPEAEAVIKQSPEWWAKYSSDILGEPLYEFFNDYVKDKFFSNPSMVHSYARGCRPVVLNGQYYNGSVLDFLKQTV